MSCMKCLSKCPYSKTPVLPPKISICVPVTFSLTFHPNFHPNILVFQNLPIYRKLIHDNTSLVLWKPRIFCLVLFWRSKIKYCLYIYIWLWHWLVNLHIWLTISSCYGSIPLTLMLIVRDSGLSTLFLLLLFSIRVFFHGYWRLTGQQGKGEDHFLFLSTTSTRSRTFRHLFAPLHVEWLLRIFNRTVFYYQTATQWDLHLL